MAVGVKLDEARQSDILIGNGDASVPLWEKSAWVGLYLGTESIEGESRDFDLFEVQAVANYVAELVEKYGEGAA